MSSDKITTHSEEVRNFFDEVSLHDIFGKHKIPSHKLYIDSPLDISYYHEIYFILKDECKENFLQLKRLYGDDIAYIDMTESEIKILFNKLNDLGDDSYIIASLPSEVKKVNPKFDVCPSKCYEKYHNNNIMSISSDFRYPIITCEEIIFEIIFSSDVDYTLASLLREITEIKDINVLLTKIKKCLVFVLTESTWYSWNGTTVQKFAKNKNEYYSSIFVKNVKTHKSKQLKLSDVLTDMYNKYGLSIDKYSDLDLMIHKKDPIISNTYKSIPLTHIFIDELMIEQGISKIRTGDKLCEKYRLWKLKKSKDCSDDIKIIIMSDNANTSRKFTNTFKKYEEISSSDKFCLKRYSTDKLEIHKLF